MAGRYIFIFKYYEITDTLSAIGNVPSMRMAGQGGAAAAFSISSSGREATKRKNARPCA